MKGLHLHIDCPAGAAGDMVLGALIDLGVPIDVIGDALDAIGAGRGRLRVQRVVKHGIAATDLKVDTSGPILDERVPRVMDRLAPASGPERAGAPRQPHSHADDHRHAAPRQPHTHADSGKVRARADSSSSGAFVAIKFRAETSTRHVTVDEHGDKTEEVHEHGGENDHAHYHYAEIRWRISNAQLPPGTRTRALDIFDRLARAEAKLHGTSLDDVTFHEVGAIDSIVDVVGTAAALDWLGPASVTCASVAMGHGTLVCAHGVLPVPAPAALEVLREAGGVMTDGGVATELCTPTGAAILAATVTHWTSAPTARPVAVGWGAGDLDLPDRANVLRVVTLVPQVALAESVWQIDANIDDMSPELSGAATDALFAAGAVDVWWTPITMKKGRPALTLSVLAETAKRDDVINTILRETTTIGVRYSQLQRTVLARQMVEVDTRYGKIPVKVAMDGNIVVNAAPEFEACASAARQHGVPVKLVFSAALAAYDAHR
ncbi:MAG TPA: nickel pincer cofactor biosynthesis protein LarC [Kofleriaceae bacterium]|nr:nickel pincer cofactor biosynthesis protein LarC [Kofleriaceae bacterium]